MDEWLDEAHRGERSFRGASLRRQTEEPQSTEPSETGVMQQEEALAGAIIKTKRSLEPSL